MTRSIPRLALAFLATLFAQALSATPELKAWLGSAFTIPGEQTELWLSVVSDTRPDNLPTEPEAPNLTFNNLGDPVFPRTTRERLYVYKFSVVSYQEGTHTIPPFEITLNGESLRSQAVDLHVAPLPENAWFDQTILGDNYRFASTIRLPKRVRFEGETTPAEVKVYFPAKFKVASASIAELNHNGVVAPRFDISEKLYPRRVSFVTAVRLARQDYFAVSYRSTVTPIQDGIVALGPGRARLTLEARILNRGIFTSTNIPLDIPVEKREFTARPLPQPAPPGYRNAVGRFQILARAETAGLREGDTITMRLTVSGRGNLDALKPPELDSNNSAWKPYPASSLPRQGERRDISGSIAFSQIIRPVGRQEIIPPFRLVVFDPIEERYHSISTPPIPFELAAAAPAILPNALLPDVRTPIEEMESILGLVDPLRSVHPESVSGWWKWWHLLPSLIAILLLAQITKLRLLPRWRTPAAVQELDRWLTAVEQSGNDSREFLRSSGSFIERWIPTEKRDEEINAVLERRDTDCFQPGGGSEELRASERKSIISLMRSRALASLSALLLLAALALASPAKAATSTPSDFYHQAQAAWEEGSFRSAIHLYEAAHQNGESPSADVLYNIANCYFQLEERGLAALFYRRALHLDPNHAEARQNLRFLKRKTGAITIVRPPYRDYLGKVNRSLFSTFMAFGIWITSLSLLSLFASLSRGLKPLIWTSLSIAPLIAIIGGVGLALYPDDLEFAPITEQAVTVNKEAMEARTEATSSSAEVILVPPGSLCRPLAQRGPWTYVELANDTRGWLPTAQIRTILPIDFPPLSSVEPRA